MVNNLFGNNFANRPVYKGENLLNTPYRNKHTMTNSTIQPVAIYTHIKNKQQKKEDDVITKKTLYFLSDPIRFIKRTIFAAGLETMLIPLTKEKSVKNFIPLALMGGAIYHYFSIASSVKMDLKHDKGESQGLMSSDFLPELFYKTFDA